MSNAIYRINSPGLTIKSSKNIFHHHIPPPYSHVKILSVYAFAVRAVIRHHKNMIGSLLHSLFLASLILWQEVIVADISGLISSSAPSPSAFPAAKPALNAFSSADLATPTLLPSPLPTIINEEDCDFEYRYDSRIEKNSGENIKIERRCQINNKNKPLQNGHDGRDNNSSLNNNLEIKVNTGGNNSNFGHILPRSGDVKIDISIKNNVE